MSAPQQHRPSIYLFTGALWVGAAAILAVALRLPSSIDLYDFLLFCALAAFAEKWDVPISSNSRMSLSFTVHLSAGILFGPAPAAAIAVAGRIAHHRWAGPPQRAALRGLQRRADGDARRCSPACAYAATGGIGRAEPAERRPSRGRGKPHVPRREQHARERAPWRSSGRSFAQEWVESSRDILLPYIVDGSPGRARRLHVRLDAVGDPYFIPLVLVIYNGFRLYVSLRHETDHALVALADSIDKRDQYTYQHSMRVARLSGEIAEAMGLTPRDIELLVAAARVHDLGKIATDNRVLFKQSSLTSDERHLIQAHPGEGGELAGRFSMFREGRRFIRHHHERWDGKGYPDGLAGEDIPLGARVIAVADSYDAMTSDRPYRRALPHEVALIELQRGAGTQFDPAVVEAYLAPQNGPTSVPVPRAVRGDPVVLVLTVADRRRARRRLRARRPPAATSDSLQLRLTWLVVVALGVQLVIFSPLGDWVPETVVVAVHLGTYGLLLRLRRPQPAQRRHPSGGWRDAAQRRRDRRQRRLHARLARERSSLAGLVTTSATHNNSAVAEHGDRLLVLGDVMAVPDGIPLFANVFSVGDVLIAVGVAVMLATAMRRARAGRRGAAAAATR